MVVYMVASPVTGYLGDRVPRKFIVAASVLVWSLATLASGLSTSFLMLLVARAMVGIGEAGYGTVAPSLICDLYPKDARTRMLSYFYLAIPLGAAAGYAIGGAVGAAHSWQMVFFVGGAPGLLLSILAFFMPEPQRGAFDPVESKTIPFRAALKLLSGNKTFLVTTAGMTLMTFSIGGLAYWMPTFLELERGMPAGRIGFLFGATTALAGISGTLVGGLVGDRMERINPQGGGGFWVSGWGLIAAAPLMIASARLHQPVPIFVCLFFAQFLLFLNNGPLNAALCNCVSPAFRAAAVGVNILIIHLLGDALSPPLIGAFGSHFSLASAVQANSLPVVVGGILLLWEASRTRKDHC